MVQVDVFWGYAWGASLAVACGRQLALTDRPFETGFWAKTLIFLSIFWAPTGLLLLIRHPSWETMQAAENFYHIPVWLVLAFGITNITQGMLGFWAGQKLMARGRYHLAQVNWLAGYFGMFFILLYGWDGLGYDRFLYDRDLFPGSPAWTPGAGTEAGVLAAIGRHFFTLFNEYGGPTVAATLYTDGLWLIPPFAFLFYRWFRADVHADNHPEPGFVRTFASYLGGVFVVALGSAAFSALTVGMLGDLFGAGDVIWHGSFYAPEHLIPHALSYAAGLPLSLAVIWYALLRPGRPFSRILEPLMAGADESGRRR